MFITAVNRAYVWIFFKRIWVKNDVTEPLKVSLGREIAIHYNTISSHS